MWNVPASTANVFVASILAGATLSLAISVSFQTDLIQTDFDINNRPWIGIDDIKVENNKIEFKYKNYGKIPNSNGMIWAKVTNFLPEKTDLLQSQNSDKLHILMPDQSHRTTLSNQELSNYISEVKNNKMDLYVSVAIDYEYGKNKDYQWGLIGKYNPESNEVDILETWID